MIVKVPVHCLLICSLAGHAAAAEFPAGVDTGDRLLQLGCLDVTKTPYLADPTGTNDSTDAIQRAVNDSRDCGLVCFFPGGDMSDSGIRHSDSQGSTMQDVTVYAEWAYAGLNCCPGQGGGR
jgi:hypothetical protein